MPRLAVIPTDPVDECRDKGTAVSLEKYLNPKKFFSDIFFLSPFESKAYDYQGMHVIPARDIELPGLIRRHQIDVVRAYGGHWPCDMAVYYRQSGVPSVVSIHDRRPRTLYPSVAYADIVLCVSEQVRELVLRYHRSPQQVWLRPNGVDFSLMRSFLPEEWEDLSRCFPGRKKILHVGRKSPEKNLETIILALSCLPPDYILLAIGPGKDSFYRQLAREQRVAERCFFVETVSHDDLPRYYSWADCCCMPSDSEAMSNVVLEACACMCPVVLSAAAAAGVGLRNDQEALIVADHRDPLVLARGISRVVSSPSLARSLADAARRMVQQYEQGRMAELEVEYYRKILDMKAAGAFRLGWARSLFLSTMNLRRRLIRKLKQS